LYHEAFQDPIKLAKILMNPQTTKKKKNFKKKKEDFDPIIKKVKVEKPKKVEDKAPEPEFEGFPIEEEEEEKLNIDKFRDLFQEKKSKLETKKARKEAELLNRIKIKAPTAEFPPLKIEEKSEDPYNKHFGLEQETLIKEKVDLIGQKAPENFSDKLIQKDFAYAFEEQDDLEILATDQDTVTNQVKIKEFQLKSSLKGVGKMYQDQMEEVWATDLKVETHSDGVVAKPFVHSAFEINAEIEEDEENNRLKSVFPIMESYYDLIYTDTNEENCMKVSKFFFGLNLILFLV